MRPSPSQRCWYCVTCARQCSGVSGTWRQACEPCRDDGTGGETLAWPSLVSGAAGREALDRASRAGRDADVLLDGAHNVDGAGAVRHVVDEKRASAVGGGSVTWVLAFSGHKDVAGILSALGLRDGDAVVTTSFETPPSMPWVKAIPQDALLTLVQGCVKLRHGYATKTVAESVDRIVENGAVEGMPELTVVAGSLYLVSSVAALIRERDRAST